MRTTPGPHPRSPLDVAVTVTDPELPMLTLADLGVLRDVRTEGDGTVVVEITPTYAGCPAMDVMRADLVHALHGAGYERVDVRTVPSPAWGTDLITAEGRRKLGEAGIAPPGRQAACPLCGSPDTVEVSESGATPCKALRRCRSCREPFEHVEELPAGAHARARTGPGARGRMGSMAEELIVLVDDDGTAVGTMPKPLVHHGETPLHRAFSAYLFSDDGRLLVTRRAQGKATFPGMWTNTVCGHPAPGEDDADAIARRARFELGLGVSGLRPALPGYRYRAEFRGVVENEICPVYLGRFSGTPAPHPEEVGEWELVDWAGFRRRQETEGDAWSPWCREQARLIEDAGLLAVAHPA